MSTSYTNLLGFALPTEGELDGTWGDVVNNSITELVEDAIAGSATASVTSGDWALTTTGSGSANQARSAILIPTGSPGVTRNIFAPSSSKAYIVHNQSNASVVVKGFATTGATVAAGLTALVAWDGTDFVLCGTVTSVDVSGGTTGLTTSGGPIKGSGTITLAGTLAATNGGTGQTSYAVGDLIYASTSTALSKLADVATGNALISGGIGVAPLYGKIGLTTHVSGTLPVANGGSGATTLTGVLVGNGTSAFTAVAAPSGAIVGTTDTQTLTNKTLTDPTVTNYTESVVSIGTVTSSNTLSLTNGTVQTATLTASTACTFTMPTATAGKSFVLMLKQAATTGNGTATFTGVKWPSTTGAPTITATAGRMDILSFFSDGTNWYGSITQGYTP